MGWEDEIAPDPVDDSEQKDIFGEPIRPDGTDPFQKLIVHFEKVADMVKFSNVIKQPITKQVRRIAYPLTYVGSGAEYTVTGEETTGRQMGLFGDAEWWEESWKGMPKFEQKNLNPWHSILVELQTEQSVEEFSKLLGQRIPEDTGRITRSIWFPEAEIGVAKGKRWISSTGMKPRAPLYIVSKGRADSRLTSKALHRMGVPHNIVVEPQEVETYKRAVDSTATVVELDMSFKDRYETCDDLGDTKGKGPGAARNFAWDHAKRNGHKWHWVMDDNIQHFDYLDENMIIQVGDGAIFRIMEDWCDRHDNVLMGGPNYCMFVPRKTKVPPYVLNTRIYSCNLIRNDIPYYWRGRYNEDTDISLRILKDGHVTVQFNQFLQLKTTTQAVKGGNTAEFYAKEGTKPKSEMQVKLHPDVSRLVWRFNRWHHYVDYKPFKQNRPKLRTDAIIPSVDPYRMEIVKK